MDKPVLIVFAVSIALCIAYPAYIILGILLRRKHKSFPADPDAVQPVSIIVVGYNEEKYIRNKILSFLSEDEWIEGSELIVVSGGSTDRTADIVREFEGHRDVRIFLFDDRMPKIDGVNVAVSHAKHDILVFSDCRQQMKKGSVRQLVSRFTDASIGTVTSTLCDNPVDQETSVTRSLLNEIAFRESNHSSSLNVFGALYAQRKSVFRTIPRDILFDDLFVIVSTIVQGKRLVQEKHAVIYDVPFDSYYGSERIERLARGLLVFMSRYNVQVRNLPMRIYLRFIIYKYLKLVVPFVLPFAMLSALYIGIVMSGPLLQVGALTSVFLMTLIPEMRQFMSLYFRVNYYFGLAVFKFYFLNKRSITWSKLDVVNVDSKSAA